MKAIILSALVLLLSMMPIDVVAQQSVTTNFGVDRVLDGVKVNAAAQCLFVDGTGTIFVGTGTDYLYRSSNGGSTWVHLMNGLKGANMPFATAYAIKASSNGTLFLGTGGDLFNSSDNGNSWNSVQGLGSTGPSDISIRDSNIFVSTFFGGSIYRSTDNGSTWSNVLNPPNSAYKAVLITKTRAVIAGDGNGDPQGEVQGIWRSTNNGASWSRADSGLIGEIGTVGDGTVDSNGNMAANGYNIWSLSCDESTGVVYAGTDGEGIFVSFDDGKSWTEANGETPMPMYTTAVLAIDGIVWAGFHNDIGTGIAGDGGLYYSSDSGATWQNVDFTGKNVNCFYPYGKDSILVGTDDGVYVVSYTTVTAVNEPIHDPTAFTLSQNYPNPFNPTTTIEFSVQKRTSVNLTVFNVLGQRVATLVNEEKTPGTYSVQFNGSNLSSGVYFYRLQAGTFVQTKKMNLLK